MTTKINMLAIDLAKGSFQLCAVAANGAVLYNRALSRVRQATLRAEQPACIVALVACATSPHWGRLSQQHGHDVRLVPAAYVKPFVRRQKNDRAEAEALAEMALFVNLRSPAPRRGTACGWIKAIVLSGRRAHRDLFWITRFPHKLGRRLRVHLLPSRPLVLFHDPVNGRSADADLLRCL